ncbi:hypothetical protein QO010_002134 [Caulobacter ginsengisoli]|uniref:Nuclease n=1 Tax=Caulobacter ginsengisoli TaxID=400775 RepID=A0ABU0IT64_9CAUL|nr:hypothetical protein [Caulobacter ginsengisoli]MDQ0464353.1 hypothetical protein [Caulobacter ginsengisoli]
MARFSVFLFFVLGALMFRPAPAQAASPCQGKPVQSGGFVRGPVLEILDARTVCVARTPGDWVPITLIQPAQSRPALMAAAFGKTATCVVGQDGRAECVIEGTSLGVLLRQPALQKTALNWR